MVLLYLSLISITEFKLISKNLLLKLSFSKTFKEIHIFFKTATTVIS